MLVTRGLGRNLTQDSLLVTAGLGRAAQAIVELGGRVIRRWRSRIYRRDVENLPITTRKEFLRRVQTALASLKRDVSPAVAKRAQRAEKGLLQADSVRRKSLLRLDFTVVLAQLDVIQWALDAYEKQRERRRREEEDILSILLAARARTPI